MKVALWSCLVLGGIVWAAPAGRQPRGGLRCEAGAGEHGLAAGGTRRAEARGAVAVLAVLLVLAAGGSVMAQGGAAERVALVIGNSDYEHTGDLANPFNGAIAMRNALTWLGFDVVLQLDADFYAMVDALEAFEMRSAGADLALVFYAGHGIEMDGTNYLVPVDASLSSARAIVRETVPLDDVLNAVADATTRIVILDACRNRPITTWIRANVRSRGLAAVVAGAGSLVAYAAPEGDLSHDGGCPFTEVLVDQIEEPGVDVRIMLGNVGEAVRERTGQQLFISSSLAGEHYLGDVTRAPPPRGSVVVEVNLDDVAVFVDGDFRGSADNGEPLRIIGLPVGLHEFMGVRRGYEPIIQFILVPPGQQVTVTLPIHYQRREDEAARDLVEHGERLLFTRSVARSQSRRDLDERARDLFMAALEEDAAYARAAYLLGHVQQLLGNRLESLDAYRLALQIDPTDVGARVQLAGVLVEVGDPGTALRELTTAARLAEPTDELYAGLAHVFFDVGAWEEAVEEARRAIALNASNGQAYLWKADALRQLADEDDGMSPVVRQSLYREARDDYRTLLNLTNFESSLGDREDVFREYRKEGYLGLCLTEHKLYNLLRAREYCERAIGYREDPIAHFVLGNINWDLYNLYQTCDYLTAAARSYSRTIEINPDLVESNNARFYLEQITGLALGCPGAQVLRP